MASGELHSERIMRPEHGVAPRIGRMAGGTVRSGSISRMECVGRLSGGVTTRAQSVLRRVIVIGVAGGTLQGQMASGVDPGRPRMIVARKTEGPVGMTQTAVRIKRRNMADGFAMTRYAFEIHGPGEILTVTGLT